MTNEELKCEMEYQIRRNIVNKMLKEKIITEQDYKEIDTKLLRKYEPVFGSLYR